jgi:predicted nucleotidyltransferase
MTQFDSIFEALQATGVRYVVVGGVAVNLHGYQRFTKDIDLVIDLVPDQALKALEALNVIGFSPTMPVKLTDFVDPITRDAWIADKGMMVFQMYSNRTRLTVDIFVKYPLDFEELWKQSAKVDLAGASVRIASLDHIILMKREAGRQQDLKIARMSKITDPLPSSFEAAELFQLRMALKSSYAERLQDLQDMIDFNVEAEARNPRLRWAAEQLRKNDGVK